MADQRPTYREALLAYLHEGSTAILTWLRNLIGGTLMASGIIGMSNGTYHLSRTPGSGSV
jgi:hypothetical protein